MCWLSVRWVRKLWFFSKEIIYVFYFCFVVVVPPSLRLVISSSVRMFLFWHSHQTQECHQPIRIFFFLFSLTTFDDVLNYISNELFHCIWADWFDSKWQSKCEHDKKRFSTKYKNDDVFKWIQGRKVSITSCIFNQKTWTTKKGNKEGINDTVKMKGHQLRYSMDAFSQRKTKSKTIFGMMTDLILEWRVDFVDEMKKFVLKRKQRLTSSPSSKKPRSFYLKKKTGPDWTEKMLSSIKVSRSKKVTTSLTPFLCCKMLRKLCSNVFSIFTLLSFDLRISFSRINYSLDPKNDL